MHWLAIAIGGIIALLGIGALAEKRVPASLAVLCFMLGSFVAGGGFWEAVSDEEDDSLLRNLGRDVRNGVVAHIEEGELCFVLIGDKNLSCIRERQVFNLDQAALGESPVSPEMGDIYTIARAEVSGQEIGVLLRLYSASSETNAGCEPCGLPSTGGGP